MLVKITNRCAMGCSHTARYGVAADSALERGRMAKKRGKPSPETVAKISAAHRGKQLTAEHRKAIGEARRGQTHSAETKEKLRKAQLGKKHSEATRAKMSTQRKGKPRTPAQLEINRGRKHGPDCLHCQKIAAVNKARALPEEERKRRRKRASQHANLLHRHGITLEQYEQMLAAQGGLCAICDAACSTGFNLAVDHDHETGAIRGLLCRQCNRGIGHFRDDPKLLRRALSYLENECSSK